MKMVGFIRSRYNFTTKQMLEVISYSELPIETFDGSDTGTAIVDDRVSNNHIGDWFILGENIFYISGTNYDHTTRTTKLTLSDFVSGLDKIKMKKSTTSTRKLHDEFYDLKLYTMGGGQYLGYFQDPVFTINYLKFDNSQYTFPWDVEWEAGNATIGQNSWYSELGEDGLVSLADLIYFTRSKFPYSFKDFTGSITTSEYYGFTYVPRVENDKLYIVVSYELAEKRGDLDGDGVNVIFDGTTELLSEDYNESATTTAASLWYGNNRYNYALSNNLSTLVETTGENAVPLSDGRMSFLYGDFKYGKFPNSMTADARKQYAYANYFWNETIDYKITFASDKRLHTNYVLHLLMPDGNVLKTILNRTITMSNGDDRYKYTCGNYRNTIVERLKFKVSKGVLRL